MLAWSNEGFKTYALGVRHFPAENICGRGRSSWIGADMFLRVEANPPEPGDRPSETVDDINGGNSWCKAAWSTSSGLRSFVLTFAACFGDEYAH